MRCVDNDRGHARLGMAVGSRAVPTAVGRNRLRRLIRESFRRHRDGLPAVDVVVIARAPAAGAPNREVFASLARLWGEIGGAR
jgi:ribonuclease P protein component